MVKHGKPAPDLFLFAADRMATPPARCLVIEDSVAGVTAGKAAGMTVLGFTGGSHCRPGHGDKLRAAGAETVLESVHQLSDHIDRARGPVTNRGAAGRTT
jgi:beta-phosphoglucomutase-like phosphatase (HAD superfamily)